MINFDKQNHIYQDENGNTLISVTQLMKKHGLAPNYDFVDADLLERKAKRGTLIHAEIEAYNKTLEVGFTEECAEYVAHVEYNGIACDGTEELVHNDIIAGTVDLMLTEQDGTKVIADIKTTSTVHKDAVSWQLSIYAYLSQKHFDKAQVYHFDKNGQLKVIDVPFKPTAEVERLIECERKGEIYKQNEIVTTSQLCEIAEFENIIAKAEQMKAEAEKRMEEIKTALLQAMEQNGIKTVDTDFVKITYVAPSTRTSLDSKRIKEELPEVYKTYSKETETKAQVRIKLK